MNKHTKQSANYRSTKRGHMATLLSRARRRAKNSGLFFDIDLNYLESLAHEICPVFGFPLAWCAQSKVRGDDAPSLDKIIPSLGYVKGNVCWVSWRANRIKNDGNAEDHRKIASWIESISGV